MVKLLGDGVILFSLKYDASFSASDAFLPFRNYLDFSTQKQNANLSSKFISQASENSDTIWIGTISKNRITANANLVLSLFNQS